MKEPFFEYPRQISGKALTREYKVVGTKTGATHTFSFSSEVVRCFSYRPGPVTPYFAHNLNMESYIAKGIKYCTQLHSEYLTCQLVLGYQE